MGNLKVVLVDDNAAFLGAASQFLGDFCGVVKAGFTDETGPVLDGLRDGGKKS